MELAMNDLIWITSAALAAVFALAAVGKLRDRAATTASLSEFGVPGTLAAPAATTLVATELLTAGLLAWPDTRALGAIVALALLAIFSAAMLRLLTRGQRPACACFGERSQKPIGWRSVARNCGLMALAGLTLAAPELAKLPPMLIASGAAGTIALIWVSCSALWLLQLTRQNGRLLLRIAALEQAASISPAPDRRLIAPGQPLTSLRLADTRGRAFDWRILSGKPSVLFFLDASCSHCRVLISALSDAQRDARINTASITPVVISDSEAIRAQLPEDIPLLLDPAWSAAGRLGVRGTPAVAWLDSAGQLDRPAEHGSMAVRTTLTRITVQEVPHELAMV
jgi:peroxiredoxin